MSAYYSIIQFVPDPVANERINAGVVVFDGERVHARFVENWDRLHRFCDQDVTFLKKFAMEFKDRTRPGLLEDAVDGSTIREIAETWKSAIQFTSPKGSLLDLEALLDDSEKRFLALDRRSVASRPHTRTSMKRFAFEAAKLAFDRLGHPKGRALVKRNYSIQGEVEQHPFSLAIANGKPIVAAEVFSFVGGDRRSQERDVQATAWAFGDVRKRYSGLELAALVMKGEDPSPAYDQAERIFNSLDIKLVPKNRVDEWADHVAGRVVASM
jgi:hypothetical protein